jgi:Ethanolamine utilization protein EutJ (predicted chaperonin)
MATDFRPGKNDIQIWRNDTWRQTFVLTQNSVAINLTGATITIQVRKGCDGVLALSASTGGNGVTIAGAGNNEITVNKLVNIAKGKYVYDINVVFSSGYVRTYLEGDFIVYEDVTKP